MNKSRNIEVKVNGILAGIILLSNLILFLPYTIWIFIDSGGPMGYGFLGLPLFVIAHLCIIAPVHVYKGEYYEKINVLLLFGAVYCSWLTYILLK